MLGPPGLMSSGLFAGRYNIERVLGQGATATVHLARDTERGISVAIKIMRPELAQSRATDRFLKEIRRTAELQHPHILRVLDSGEHEGRPYFVLPYMEGGTLRWKLRGGNQLAFDETVSILRTVAEALDYAHTKGLIHRDVKPENILFTSGQACLGDFGIARALETVYGTDGSTSSNTVRGTYAYMSPEQAAGGMNLDGRSDIYSLACVAYEMVTGMQAFIGPTPEAVVAQRFAYTPREVRVYRPSAPPEVDTALAKAFAMSPADRYKTATEFVNALAVAAASSSAPTVKRRETPVGVQQDPKQRRIFAIGAATLLVAATILVTKFGPGIGGSAGDSPAVDTTRLVVLPLERDSSAPAPWRDDDLLHQAFTRWRGVAVIDQFLVADAMRRHGAIRTSDDAAAIATSLGAGRYIRGRVTSRGNGWHISASIYDASQGHSLYQASGATPNDLAGAAATYASVADSLLLRGAKADPSAATASRARSLPAVQAFGRAQAALSEWDLVAADSALQAATSFDPEFARASLWLAQVRAWQNLNRNTWGTFAERAAASSEQLDDREARLARALVHLAKGSYDKSCAIYDSLVVRNDRDFPAWFGVGQCHMLNKLVVADSKSPSGWRFQMSAHRGMQAYTKAFEILPSVYLGYERGAFQRLRSLLLVSSQQIVGYGASDSALFYARPGWIGDSLVLVPYPVAVSASGAPIPPGFDEALRRRRNDFRRLAANWSAAFPRSPGAKQAVAISLEQLGDPTAIDTIRLARTLATDDAQKAQLAAAEVMLLVKFGTPDRPEYISKAKSMADSLLDSRRKLSADESRALVPVAVLTGRCRAAEMLIRNSGFETGARVAFSEELYVESQSLLVRVTLGCEVLPGFSLRDLATAINREASRRDISTVGVFDGFLLLRNGIQAAVPDAQVLNRLASSTNHPLAIAAAHAARGANAEGRNALEAHERSWGRSSPTADFGYAAARTWLVLGDTSNALRVLDIVLSGLAGYEPYELQDAGRMAGFVAAAILRSDLAAKAGDEQNQKRWSGPVARLWADADPSLRPIVSRMSRSAGSP